MNGHLLLIAHPTVDSKLWNRSKWVLVPGFRTIFKNFKDSNVFRFFCFSCKQKCINFILIILVSPEGFQFTSCGPSLNLDKISSTPFYPKVNKNWWKQHLPCGDFYELAGGNFESIWEMVPNSWVLGWKEKKTYGIILWRTGIRKYISAIGRCNRRPPSWTCCLRWFILSFDWVNHFLVVPLWWVWWIASNNHIF